VGFGYLNERYILDLLFVQVTKQGMGSDGAGTAVAILEIFSHIKQIIA